VKRTGYIVMAAGAIILAIFVSPLPAEDRGAELQAIRQITEDSKNLVSSGIVKELKIGPSPTRYMEAGDWILTVNNKADHWSMILFAPKSLRKPPTPATELKKLNSLADQHAVPNYTMLKVYSVRDGDDPKKTFLVNAGRNELSIIAYNDKDNMVCYLDLEALQIPFKPALFFARGDDSDGRFLKILVLDEDNISRLHRGSSRYAIVKYYPAAMKVSSSGAVTIPARDLYAWKGKRQE